MTKEERDRALLIVDGHIEDGKQLIRDKRILIKILEREVDNLTSMFKRPWKAAEFNKRLESVYAELDRADHDIDVQRSKNSKLRDIRSQIRCQALPEPQPMLLLTHNEIIVASS